MLHFALDQGVLLSRPVANSSEEHSKEHMKKYSELFYNLYYAGYKVVNKSDHHWELSPDEIQSIFHWLHQRRLLTKPDGLIPLKVSTRREFVQDYFRKVVSSPDNMSGTEISQFNDFCHEFDENNWNVDWINHIPVINFQALQICVEYELPVKLFSANQLLQVVLFQNQKTTQHLLMRDLTKHSNVKFPNIPRAKRRYYISLLEQCITVADASRYLELWKRFGEILHPGDYRFTAPRTVRVFSELRNLKRQNSWYKLLYQQSSLVDYLYILGQKPDEFLKHYYDMMLLGLSNNDVETVKTEFLNISNKLSIEDLIAKARDCSIRISKYKDTSHVEGSFKSRQTFRLAHEIGDISKSGLKIMLETLKTAIIRKYSQLLEGDSLKKIGTNVWITPDLKQVPIPANLKDLTSKYIEYWIEKYEKDQPFSLYDLILIRLVTEGYDLVNEPEEVVIDDEFNWVPVTVVEAEFDTAYPVQEILKWLI